MILNPTLHLMYPEKWHAFDITPEEQGERQELKEVISGILNLAEIKVSHTPTAFCCHWDY